MAEDTGKSRATELDRKWAEWAELRRQFDKIEAECSDDTDDCCAASGRLSALGIAMDKLSGSDCRANFARFKVIDENSIPPYCWEAVETQCKNAVRVFVDPGDQHGRWRVWLFADHSVLVFGGGSISGFFHFNLCLTQYPHWKTDTEGCIGQLGSYCQKLGYGV